MQYLKVACTALLGEAPVPPLDEPAGLAEFTRAEISSAEFASAWRAATSVSGGDACP
jgi:hypothetical protein